MKTVNQLNQPNEKSKSFPTFEVLNKLEMNLIKGGDGDDIETTPPPPPPPVSVRFQ